MEHAPVEPDEALVARGQPGRELGVDALHRELGQLLELLGKLHLEIHVERQLASG